MSLVWISDDVIQWQVDPTQPLDRAGSQTFYLDGVVFLKRIIFLSKMEILVDNEGLSHIGLDIFTYLDPSSLAQARLVCRSWCMLITRSRVWWTSKLSQFKRKTKRIEGENGIWVLMPRNHERWNYWKKPIKHFMKKANLDYLERFTLYLINEVPFVEDKTAGNVAQIR